MRKLLLSLVAVLLGFTAYASEEQVLWEGSVELTWSANPTITADKCANFEEGGEIAVYYTVPESYDYLSLGVVNPSWSNYSWGGSNGVVASANVKRFTIAAEDVADITSKGFILMGWKLTVTKISYFPSEGPVDPTVLLKDPFNVTEPGYTQYSYDEIVKAGGVVGGGLQIEYQVLNPASAFITYFHEGVEVSDQYSEEEAPYVWADFTDPTIINTDVDNQVKRSLLVFTSETMAELNSVSKNLIIQCAYVRITSVKVVLPEDMPDMPDLAMVTFENESMVVGIGNTEQIVATIKPAGSAVTWTSSNPDVATVDNEGNVTGVAGGTATITASIEGASASCEVTVAGIKFVWKDRQDGVAIYGDAADIEEYVGNEPRLYVTPIPADATMTLSYEKAANGEYTVYNSLTYTDKNVSVVLKKACEVKLTIKIAKYNYEKTFTVIGKEYDKPTIAIKRGSGNNIPYDEILAGSTYKLAATIEPDADADAYYDSKYENKIVWSSSDTSIATVEPSGLYWNTDATVTSYKGGTVTITAKMEVDGLETVVGERELTFIGHGEKVFQFYFRNDRGGSWTSMYNTGYVAGNDVVENVTLYGTDVNMILNTATTVSFIPKFTAGQSFTFKALNPLERITLITASPASSATALVTFGDKTTCSTGKNEKTSWSADDEMGAEEVTFTVDDDKEVAGLIYWNVTLFRFEAPELEISETETLGVVGYDKQLTATVTNANDDYVLVGTTTWSSSDPEVATVDENGLVTFVSKGNAEITAENNGSKAVCAVTISERTGIEDLDADSANGPAEYFNLQGMRVDANNLTPGVYLVRKGNEVKKVVVK